MGRASSLFKNRGSGLSIPRCWSYPLGDKDTFFDVVETGKFPFRTRSWRINSDTRKADKCHFEPNLISGVLDGVIGTFFRRILRMWNQMISIASQRTIFTMLSAPLTMTV